MRSIKEIKRLQKDTLVRIKSAQEFLETLDHELKTVTASVKKRGKLMNMDHVLKIERALETFKVKGKCVGFGLIAVDDENPTVILGWYAPDQLYEDLSAHFRKCGINLEDVDFSEAMSVNHDLYTEIYETTIYDGPEEWCAD